MGWLADRMKRIPIVAFATLAAALFTFMSGLAGSAFILFWTLCLTGVAKANNLAVHQPLLADNYPIGIRARMSAAMNIGQQVLGNLSPVIVGAIATWAGGVEGWRWAFFVLGIPGAILAFVRVHAEGTAARPVREAGRARRGRRRREPDPTVDGSRVRPAEEDRHGPHVDRRVRRTRLRRVRARRAAGALPERHTARHQHPAPGLHPEPLGLDGGAVPVSRRPLFRPHVSQESVEGAGTRRGVDPAVGVVHSPAGLHAQRHVVRHLGHPAIGAHRLRIRDGHAGAASRVPVSNTAASAWRWASCTWC